MEFDRCFSQYIAGDGTVTNVRPNLVFVRSPLVDPKTGILTDVGARFFQDWMEKTDPTLKATGEFLADAPVEDRTEGIGTTVQNLDSKGQADDGFVVTRANEPGILVQGKLTGTARHDDVITFANIFDTVPTVRITAANSLSFATADSANDQLLRLEGLNVTTTGFKVKAVILVDDFSTTARSVNATGVAPDQTATKNLAAEAYDDQYTFQYDVTVNAAEEKFPGVFLFSSITLGFWERASGGTFVLRASQNHTNESDSALILLNQTKSINVDGAALNHEFLITVESTVRNGGSLDSFDTLSWAEASGGLTERDATPDASNYIFWTATEGENG